jgi:hypothetical protein
VNSSGLSRTSNGQGSQTSAAASCSTVALEMSQTVPDPSAASGPVVWGPMYSRTASCVHGRRRRRELCGVGRLAGLEPATGRYELGDAVQAEPPPISSVEIPRVQVPAAMALQQAPGLHEAMRLLPVGLPVAELEPFGVPARKRDAGEHTGVDCSHRNDRVVVDRVLQGPDPGSQP